MLELRLQGPLVCYWHARLVVGFRRAVAAIARAGPMHGEVITHSLSMQIVAIHTWFLATDCVSSAKRGNQHHLHICHEARGHITTAMRYAPPTLLSFFGPSQASHDVIVTLVCLELRIALACPCY